MTEKKITKRENFEAIAAFLAAEGKEDWATVINHEIELLDNKAAKAKAKAAEKKVSGDALTDAVFAAVGTEFETIADIAARVEGEDVTVAKVSYRLAQLAKNDRIEKGEVTIPGGEGTKARKLVGYKHFADAE